MNVFQLLSSTDVSGALDGVARFVDTGPGYVATVIALGLLWAAGRAFLR